VLTTGADGRFKLAGFGRERVVHLHVTGPAIASTGLEVMTRANEKVKGAELDPFDGVRHVYGAAFDYVAVASRPIRGVVRDKATGKPLAGAWVYVEYWVNPNYEVNPSAKALTDKEGRYELLGLAKSARYSLAVRPAAGQLYFQREVSIRDTPGLGPLTADIDMVRGLTVRGKVTDKATGKPVAGAMVDYHPLYANPYVNKPEFGKPRSEATTGPDGSYALTVVPGAGVIGVVALKPDAYMPALVTLKERKAFFKAPLAFDVHGDNILVPAYGNNAAGAPLAQDTYNAIVLLEPGEKEEGLVKDVALERPQERKGRVVGPDGQPLTGVKVTGLVQRYDQETLEGAEFTVRRINPKAKRQLVFHHKDKNLGFILKELPGEKADPLVIKLQPCGSVSGRMVDRDGQPRAGLRIDISAGFYGTTHHELTTDKDGRFRAEGLLPGAQYQVFLARLQRDGGLASVTVEPSKHKDMGDVKPGRFEK
jgi:protocatechuate 3,4-dioxygenase beta subunit